MDAGNNRFMKSLALLLFVLYSVSLSSQQNYEEIRTTVTQYYYISSSTGRDTNSGTEDSPLRSISSLKNKKNVCVRLKCGDVFYENIKGFSGSVIESYGKGRKPVICGFRILKNVDAWVSVEEGVWQLDMLQAADFVGFPVDKSSDKKRFTDVGCMYDAQKDEIYGHIVKEKDMLIAEGDIYLSDKYKIADIGEETFRYFLFKYAANPRILGHVCFSVFEHGMTNMKNCIIRNIAVVGFGRHGMCGLNDCFAENCEIDIIGGSIQTGTTNWARFGNGIEFWITKNPIGNSVVQNCIISRTYDCGATIQGSPKDLGNPTNIYFKNNTFVHCRQAFEHFLNSTNTTPQYVSCEFTGNVAYMMGDNGFNSAEKRDANILSYERNAKYLKITDNEFYGGNYYCGYQKPEGMSGNRVYLYEGQYLVHYHGSKNFPTIYATDESSVKEYQEKWEDDSEIVILKKDSRADRKIQKKFLKKIKYTTLDLQISRLLQTKE